MTAAKFREVGRTADSDGSTHSIRRSLSRQGKRCARQLAFVAGPMSAGQHVLKVRKTLLQGRSQPRSRPSAQPANPLSAFARQTQASDTTARDAPITRAERDELFAVLAATAERASARRVEAVISADGSDDPVAQSPASRPSAPRQRLSIACPRSAGSASFGNSELVAGRVARMLAMQQPKRTFRLCNRSSGSALESRDDQRPQLLNSGSARGVSQTMLAVAVQKRDRNLATARRHAPGRDMGEAMLRRRRMLWLHQPKLCNNA